MHCALFPLAVTRGNLGPLNSGARLGVADTTASMASENVRKAIEIDGRAEPKIGQSDRP